MRSLIVYLLVLSVFTTSTICAQSAKPKLTTIPEREIPEAKPRGEPYPVPPTKWEKRPVIWGWSCELEDGSGFSFGGVDQTAEDGSPHTRIRVDGAWKSIADDLRKKNPLQEFCKKTLELRNNCKDSLSTARNIFFEGKTAAEEEAVIKSDVQPVVEKLSKDISSLISELKNVTKLEKYESEQVKFALSHINVSAELIKPYGIKITADQMTNMRRAQIQLEIAAEALDAEPAGRALSVIAYEPKTKSFVIFGGDHMDYLTNDLWVFDVALQKWFLRHQEAAPEIRGDHHFEALEDGRLVMFGGYSLNPNESYKHIGPARWIYDIAKNTWTPDGHSEKTYPSDTRSDRYVLPSGPEAYMKCPAPDAIVNEAKLKALPVNAWVRLETPIAVTSRDWSTWSYDAERDMLLLWAGGHASYAGNDVARYHIKTDRWEISDVTEVPLGCCGTNEQYPSGVNFNKRPWVKKHVWNSQSFNPDLKKMMLAGVNEPELDPCFYLYDPSKAEWTSRHHVPKGFGNGSSGIQIRPTVHGMLSWYGEDIWLFDAKKFEWEKVVVKGKVPGTAVDSCGMAYDSKRDRMLFFTQGGYGKPYTGRIDALDLKTMQMEMLNPEGMLPDASNGWVMFLREAIYDPKNDLFLFPQELSVGGKISSGRFPTYDAGKNKWVTLKLITESVKYPTPFSRWNQWVCSSIVYDVKRDLFWLGDASGSGGIWVLRLDMTKTEVVPLKDQIQTSEKK